MREEIEKIIDDFNDAEKDGNIDIDKALNALIRLRDNIKESDLSPDFDPEKLKEFCCAPYLSIYCDYCGKISPFRWLGWKLRYLYSRIVKMLKLTLDK